MRTLTKFETATISGGDFHTVMTIPADKVSNEDAMIIIGMGCGITGAIGGFAIGVAASHNNPICGGLILGGLGLVAGGIGVPAAFKGAIEGTRYIYRAIGLT